MISYIFVIVIILLFVNKIESGSPLICNPLDCESKCCQEDNLSCGISSDD